MKDFDELLKNIGIITVSVIVTLVLVFGVATIFKILCEIIGKL